MVSPATSAVPRLTRSAFRSWLAGLDAFLFDCDGVLWRGDTLIPGATAMLELLRSLGKQVVFVTNNSTKTRETYVKKLAAQGIVASAEDIVTSAWATAHYMKNEGIPVGSKVYYVGESGLGQELATVGYVPLGLDHSDVRELPAGPFTVDNDIRAVVVGLDRYVSFYKVAYASTCVRQIPGCRFIGTNPDPTFPVDGAILPAGGSLIKFVETGAGRAPEAVVGKPSQDLLKTILATYNLNPLSTCMVGDRLSTDIEFGKRGGLHTLLVLSGVTHESDLTTIEDPTQIPDFVVDSVDAINEFYRETTEEQ